MKDHITIKLLNTLDDMIEMQKLEKRVWGMDPIPIHQTFTAAKNGGILLGAFAGDMMVGFNYGFPGFREGRIYLCSHMTGVDPNFQSQGLGRLIKEKQKETALEYGYQMIQWTFDPLESVNANLNLRKLRGITANYTENLYGVMKDSLNNGLPSDRFTVQWWIDSEHVNEQRYCSDEIEPNKDNVLLSTYEDKSGLLLAGDLPDNIQNEINSGEAFFVPIPSRFQMIKKKDMNRAIDWRLKTRKVFQALLSKGFVGVDVRRNKDGLISHYVFVKKEGLLIEERGVRHG